jgi:hypothetical protein
MIPKTDSNINQNSLDSLIERTLARDAESTRGRFAIVPNARLTAKLALTTASRGLLSSLTAKLALYTGAALVVGSALYFIPSIGHAPIVPPSAVPSLGVQKVIQPSSSSTPLTKTGAKPIASPAVSKTNTETAPAPAITSPKHPLQLDEGDDKNIQKIVDPNYLPPIK